MPLEKKSHSLFKKAMLPGQRGRLKEHRDRDSKCSVPLHKFLCLFLPGKMEPSYAKEEAPKTSRHAKVAARKIKDSSHRLGDLPVWPVPLCMCSWPTYAPGHK